MMACLRFFFLAIGFFFSVVGTSLSYAEPTVIGLVVWVTGNMKAASSGATARALTRKSPIYETDTITTDKNGSGEIVFMDNSIITMRNDSSLQITQYHFNKNKPTGNSETLNLIKGGFRTLTGTITKEDPSSYKAMTPVATIGVAGTAFSVYFDNQKNDLFTQLDIGKVFVANADGTITLSKAAPTGGEVSKCGGGANIYCKVSGGKPPAVVCKQPEVFHNEPPLIPVNFPTNNTNTTVGSFCIS